MKKYICLVFLLMFTFILGVKAECTSKEKKELKEIANEIKVKYDIKSEKVHFENDPTFGTIDGEKETVAITFYNINSDLFLKVTTDDNTYNDEKPLIINSSNSSDGKYVLESMDIYNIVKYTIKIYSDTNCGTNLLKTITFVKPKYNVNYGYDICKEYSEIPVCQKYVTKEIKDYSFDIDDYVNSYVKSHNIKITKKVEKQKEEEDFVKNNYIYFIIGGVIIIGSVVTYVVITKKRSAL